MEVKVTEENERIDKYIAKTTDLSRTLISKMIDNGFILVNNKKTKNNYKVKLNDIITIDENYKESTDVLPEKMDLNIVYEDNDILIINKPLLFNPLIISNLAFKIFSLEPRIPI